MDNWVNELADEVVSKIENNKSLKFNTFGNKRKLLKQVKDLIINTVSEKLNIGTTPTRSPVTTINPDKKDEGTTGHASTGNETHPAARLGGKW